MPNRKVILNQEVDGLGAAGDIVEVSAGYARNLLLPRGWASAWTAGAEKPTPGTATMKPSVAARL